MDLSRATAHPGFRDILRTEKLDEACIFIAGRVLYLHQNAASAPFRSGALAEQPSPPVRRSLAESAARTW
jgi:hypothetical protein